MSKSRMHIYEYDSKLYKIVLSRQGKRVHVKCETKSKNFWSINFISTKGFFIRALGTLEIPPSEKGLFISSEKCVEEDIKSFPTYDRAIRYVEKANLALNELGKERKEEVIEEKEKSNDLLIMKIDVDGCEVSMTCVTLKKFEMIRGNHNQKQTQFIFKATNGFVVESSNTFYLASKLSENSNNCCARIENANTIWLPGSCDTVGMPITVSITFSNSTIASMWARDAVQAIKEWAVYTKKYHSENKQTYVVEV